MAVSHGAAPRPLLFDGISICHTADGQQGRIDGESKPIVVDKEQEHRTVARSSHQQKRQHIVE